MSIYYRKEHYREQLFCKSLHLKSIRNNLLRILSNKELNLAAFIEAFKRYYPCEWEDIELFCKNRKRDYLRRKKKRLRTVCYYSPEQFMRYHITLKKNFSIDEKTRLELIGKMDRNAVVKKENREKKLKANMVMVQQVCPSYVSRLIKSYFNVRRTNTLDINARYLILLEASQFKCQETIEFLFKINACDKNDDLRYLAFLSLQRLGEHPWLARKRKGRQRLSQIRSIDIERNPTELLHFIYKYQHKIYTEYDIFLSHSSLDTRELLDTKMILNKRDKTVYIDWVNDNVMLDRKNQNEDTWKVLEQRMSQSKVLVFVMTENSIKSKYVEKEINFFKKLQKPVWIYQPHNNPIENPSFIEGCQEIKNLEEI